MAANRIEQTIDDIIDLIEGCKPQPFSQTKIVVPRDELYDLLDELRQETPEEISRLQKLVSNRDAILESARTRAKQIEAEAEEHVQQMVTENEIMQRAYQQANEMVTNATAKAESIVRAANDEAEQIRTGALAYTNDILLEAERILSVSYSQSKSISESLVQSLEKNLKTVKDNRGEIQGQIYQGVPSAAGSVMVDSKEGIEEDYNFDPDTFMNGVQ